MSDKNQKIIAIVFVVLMLGSSMLYGLAAL